MVNQKYFSIFILILMIGIMACMPSAQIGKNEKTNTPETLKKTVQPTKPIKITATLTETPGTSTLLTATLYGSLMPPTPDTSMQTYVDPEGWYQVLFPAEFKYYEKENRFRNESRFFESGYLPEFGTMSSLQNVCTWIVNVLEENPEDYSIYWMGGESCEINSDENAPGSMQMVIYENPGADAAHRFLYTKASRSSDIRFSWLKAVEDTKFVNEETDFSLSPDGWDNLGSLMSGVKVTEIELEPGANPPRQGTVQGFNGEDLYGWIKQDFVSIAAPTPQWVNMVVPDLGYDLVGAVIKQEDGSEYDGHQLLRDGRILFDDVENLSRVYMVENGEDSFFTFEVSTRSGEAFLIQNDVIHPWTTEFQDPKNDALVYEDAVLWLKLSEDWDQINVVKTKPGLIETIYSWTVTYEPMYSVDTYLLWNDQWVWASKDFLIKNGKVVNAELGVQEIFLWKPIDDQEFFFFRKDGRLGFFYGGEYYPLPYQDMARNLCCGYAVNNPLISYQDAHFFAMREGVWYYVIIEY
jgi:hypothetical protein